MLDLEYENLDNVKKIIELYDKLKDNIEQYYAISSELSKARGRVFSWRNTKMEYWRDITKKYDEKDLLNCYGDIFFITKKENIDGVVTYTGRRILWNLELSKELYHIEERIDHDGDEYISTDYVVYYWSDDE